MQCCCWVAAVALCASAVGEVPEHRLAAAKTQIQRAITVQQHNAHLGRLAALRTLRDPALEPIFRALVDDPQWTMQVHGMLGLSELTTHGLDPVMLLALNPRAREQAVLVVLDEGTLPTKRLLELLPIDTIEPHLQALFADEARHRDLPIDLSQLARLLDSGDPRAAGRSAMLLAAEGDRTALPTLDGLIMQWEEPRQLEAAFSAMQTLGRHPGPAGARWVDDLLEAETRPGPQRFALMTLLKCDRDMADPRWSLAMAQAKRHRHRVDLALVRLMAGAPFSAEAREMLGPEDLLHRIADAADAVAAARAGSTDTAGAKALVALVDTGHGRSIEWLLGTAADHDPRLVQPAMERLIERISATDTADATSMDQGLRAAIALHGIDPARMRQLLADAPDEGPRQQALLLAALQLDDGELAHVAEGIHRIGLSTADSMTLLLKARWLDDLATTEIDQLGLIMDGARLSDPLRTQAAWLLLRHTGRHTTLLSGRIKSPNP